MNLQRKILLWLQKLFSRVHLGSGLALNKIKQYLYFMDFEERDSDVYIVTFLKSGTTWTQVIVYNLLTDGNMDFEHIYDVSPWIRNEAYVNHSAKRVNDLPSPRIIKSHDEYNFFDPKVKGKFIHVHRNGKDVAVSLYHHNKNYKDPNLEFDKNFDDYFRKEGKKNFFSFNRDWFTNKHKFEVLYVSYEAIKEDFEATVQKIADYLNVELTEEKLAKVKQHSSFEFMKAHETKFGEQPKDKDKRVYDQFIRKGESGEGRQMLSEEQSTFFNIKWEMQVKPFLEKRKQSAQLHKSDD